MSNIEHTSNDIQFVDVADLGTNSESLPANPSIGKRPTNSKVEIVRPWLGCKPILERTSQYFNLELLPTCIHIEILWVYLDPASGGAHGCHVHHYPIAH